MRQPSRRVAMAPAIAPADIETEIVIAGSEKEAIAAFGDGTDVTVVGGGTIVLPQLTHRRLRPAKALLLGRAGMAGIREDASRVIIGSTTPVDALTAMPAPLGPCA